MVKSKRSSKRKGRRRNVFVREMAARKQMKKILGTWELTEWMTEDHQDVLQNIEFALVSVYRANKKIDDAAMGEALKCAILSELPAATPVEELVQALAEIREVRSDISDDIWRNGLRVVLQSVHRHSNLKPGRRDYIDFVSQYVL